MPVPQCRSGNAPQGRSNKPAASGLSWERDPGDRNVYLFFFFLLCFLVVATLVTPEAPHKPFGLHRLGQDRALLTGGSFGGASILSFKVASRKNFLSPVRLIHENLLFGHLIARDAWGSGCRRTEEAAQGSYPNLHGVPLLHLAAAMGSIPLGKLFVQPQNPSHEGGRAHQHPGPGWPLRAQRLIAVP